MSQEHNKELSQYFYRSSAADFTNIPGSPIAYWLPADAKKCFGWKERVDSSFELIQGMITGDNARYVRAWQEVSVSKFSIFSSYRNGWVPYNKGGEARKWYGNHDLVVDWSHAGNGFTRNRATNSHLYFRPYVSWSYLNSGVPAARYYPDGFIWDVHGSGAFPRYSGIELHLAGLLCSKVGSYLLSVLNPTMSFQVENISALPWSIEKVSPKGEEHLFECVRIAMTDWDSFETSWNFQKHHLLDIGSGKLSTSYKEIRDTWHHMTKVMQRNEEINNNIYIEAYGLKNEITPDVPLEEVTLTCNPHYRYGGNRSEDELESLLQCDTFRELISYSIGCMMGRYSLDKPGLVLASQGETLQDYLREIQAPRFAPDDDGILPLTDQEWFADDATNRFREFVRTAWGEKTLQENLDFVAERLCLHAIKPKKGEDSLDTIRRYLSSQFYKDHLRTYKKRPIYWLFSSGKHKAFECLVYLHRYNEGSLARMRTEYVIPLTTKLNAHANKLEKDIDASSSTAEKKALEKQLSTLHNQQAELASFDENLRHYADQRIRLDLDDGVKVNYGKFGDLLAEVNAITGGPDE